MRHFVVKAAGVTVIGRIATFVGVLSLSASAVMTLSPVPAAAEDTTRTSFATLVSTSPQVTPGDALWRDDQILVVGSPSDGLTVTLLGQNASIATINVRAPAGSELAVGAYENAFGGGAAKSGQPALRVSDTSGCDDTQGRFTVREIAPDLGRLWLTYQQQCIGEPYWTFGEIHLGAPVAGNLLVAGSAVEWPTGFPGRQSEIASLAVFNLSSEPVALEEPTITGDKDFAIYQNLGCTTIAAANNCTITLAFTPSVPGERSAALSIGTVGGPAQRVELAGRGIPGNTLWEAFGEDGSSIARGHSTLHGYNAAFYAEGTPQQVRVRMQRALLWNLTFTAPPGESLRPGLTVPSGPGKDGGVTLRTNGRDGPAGPGWFTIHEIEFDEFGRLTSLSATLEDRVQGDPGPVFGTLAYAAKSDPQPMPGIAGRAPAPAFSLTATPGFDEVALKWTELAPPDLADTVVRGAEGATAPATPSSGFAVAFTESKSVSYVDNTATARGLRPGTTYSFSVFVRDTEGKASPPVSVTVRPSIVTLTTSTKTVPYWDQVTFTGTVRSSAGALLSSKTVEIYARQPGKPALFFVGKTTTDAHGAFRLQARPAIVYEYLAFFDGGPGAGLGDVSTPIRVTVAMGVAVANSVRGYGVIVGHSFQIATVVGPESGGQPVKLQEFVKGKWVTLETKKLRKNGKVTLFTVRMTKVGYHKYRVFKAGNRNYANGHSETLKIYCSEN